MGEAVMRIGMSSGVECVQQPRKLFAKSVASYPLVCWSHGLEMVHQGLRLWIGTMEQTVVIRVAGHIERRVVK